MPDPMSLLFQFRKYIREHELLVASDKILITVSGGVDSMTLLHLLSREGIAGGVAHCNFSLRGIESDQDEYFVKEKAEQLKYPFHGIRFDTLAYARDRKISIQMAARELRYEWFEELSKEFGYTAIALAHNLDDRIETFFINLIRGTGLAGLGSMRPRQGILIRPLLFASRDKIALYARQEAVAYREDSSNLQDEYLRNYLRHHVLSGMKDHLQSFHGAMAGNLDRFAEAGKLCDYAVKTILSRIVKKTEDLIALDLSLLRTYPSPELILYEWLKPYGFTSGTAVAALSASQGISGKQFFSKSHRLLCDREVLLLEERIQKESKVFYLEDSEGKYADPLPLSLEVFQKPSHFDPDPETKVLCVDRDLVLFPLILRRWRQGDYFCPMGMSSLKKVSDFFINEKLSRIEKENTWLLCSGDEIVWIVGRRPDHRFRVRPETVRILRITLQ